MRWTQLLADASARLMVAKTFRPRLLTIPGRLTRTARRWTLHLLTDWPWRHEFDHALRRLRALPALA